MDKLYFFAAAFLVAGAFLATALVAFLAGLFGAAPTFLGEALALGAAFALGAALALGAGATLTIGDFLVGVAAFFTTAAAVKYVKDRTFYFNRRHCLVESFIMQYRTNLTFLCCGGFLSCSLWGRDFLICWWGCFLDGRFLLLIGSQFERGFHFYKLSSFRALVEGSTKKMLRELDGWVISYNVGLDRLGR
jgi:hypothetical protein